MRAGSGRAGRFHVLLEDGLGVGDRQRRILSEGLEHLVHELLEGGIGQYLVHESHRQRLVGLVAPSEEHDLPRARMADGLEQALVPLDVIGEAKARRRHAELRRSRAVAQVAGERDLHPAAKTVAGDHRHRRLERALDRVKHAIEQVVVLPYGLFIGALRVEFGDIGPCRERLGAGAAERHAAHLRVGVELLHRRRDAAPHGVVDRVAPRRLVEHDPAYAAFLLND